MTRIEKMLADFAAGRRGAKARLVAHGLFNLACALAAAYIAGSAIADMMTKAGQS